MLQLSRKQKKFTTDPLPSINNKDIEQQIEDSRSDHRNGKTDEEQGSHCTAGKNSKDKLITENVKKKYRVLWDIEAKGYKDHFKKKKCM